MSKLDNEAFIQQRQQQIIAAAKVCFSRSGFHGASMAEISRESALGAGQIYRYFSSKELLVDATIKNIVQSWQAFLLEKLPLQNSTTDIIHPDSAFWQHWPLHERQLLLEVYSEASRNQNVRAILAQSEQDLVAALEAIFAQQMPQCSAAQCANCVQFLLLLVDGVACRSFGESDLDNGEVQRINDILTRHLFS